MPTPSERLGLNKFDAGETDWSHDDLVDTVDELVDDRGTFVERPDIGTYDGEKFYATDRNIVYEWDDTAAAWEGAMGVGTADNPLPGTAYREAVHTDEINSTYWIKSGDDAQTIIEGAPTQSVFILEPGATFDAADIQFPNDHLVIGQGATFLKSANGPIATVGDDSYMLNVEFDGNKANFTGDGVVDGHNDAIRVNWQNVEIHDCAGDGRVHDGRSRARYPLCRFYLNDGYGVVETHTDTDSNATDTRCRRNRYPQTFISSNGAGGILADTRVEETVYRPRVGANGGAGFEFNPNATTDYLEGVEFGGTWQNNDGPMFYMAGGQCRQVEHYAHVKTNVDNLANTPMSTATAPVGQVHFEGADDIDLYEISGGHMRTGGTDAGAAISGQSGVIEKVRITGGGGPSTESIEGASMNLYVYDRENWAGALNVDTGIAFDTNPTGKPYLKDLQNLGHVYLGAQGGVPSDADYNSVYLDTGANTGDGTISWRATTDGGTTWTDI